jgi:hypothetical protein
VEQKTTREIFDIFSRSKNFVEENSVEKVTLELIS